MRHYTITTRIIYADNEAESVTEHRDTAHTARLCAQYQHERETRHGQETATRFGVGLALVETEVTTWRDGVRGRVIQRMTAE